MLTAAFGMLSCSEPPAQECKEHADENGDGICDACGEKTENNEQVIDPGASGGNNNESENGNGNGNNSNGEMSGVLADLVIGQIESAASAKIDLTYHLSQCFEVTAEPSEEVFADGCERHVESIVNYTVTVSKDKETLNASVYAKIQKRSSPDEEYTTAFDGMLMYLVGNMLYSRDTEREIYYQKPVDAVTVSELAEAVRAVLGDISVPTDSEITELKKSLEEAFLATFDKNGNVATLTIDAKEPLTELLTYLKGIDAETKTAEDILNDIISSVYEDITVSDITEKLYELLPLSVNEALARFEEWTLQQMQMTAQQFYDSIAGDGNFIKSLENSLRLRGVAEEKITEIISELSTLNIEAAILEYEIGETPLVVLLEQLTIAYNAPEAAPWSEETGEQPSVTELIEKVKAAVSSYLSMTVKELIELYGEAGAEEIYQSIVDFAAVDEAKANVKITFFEGYNLSHAECNAEAEFTYGMPAAEGVGCTELVRTEAEAYVKIYDLSLKSVEIIPDDDFVFDIPRNK